MDKVKNVVGVNLAILVFYMAIVAIRVKGSHDAEALIAAAFLISAHVGLNLLFCIISIFVDRTYCAPFFLGALAVAVVGFSSCYGMVASS